MLAFIYRVTGKPKGENPTLQNSAPQHIGIYVSNRHIAVHATIDIYWNQRHPEAATASLSLEAQSPARYTRSSRGTILVTSTIPDEQPASLQYMPIVNGSNGTSATRVGITLPVKEAADLFTKFSISNTIQKTKDNLYIHLPSIGNDSSQTFYPVFLSAGNKLNEPPVELVYGLIPNFFTSNSPQGTNGYDPSEPSPIDYQLPLDGPIPFSRLIKPTSFFWNPLSLSTTETLHDIAPDLRGDRIDSMFPSGTLRGSNFTWHSTGSLEPYLSATNLASAASESNDEFRSAIAFGAAAAAGVALAQELPEALLPPWRRRNSKPSRTR